MPILIAVSILALRPLSLNREWETSLISSSPSLSLPIQASTSLCEMIAHGDGSASRDFPFLRFFLLILGLFPLVDLNLYLMSTALWVLSVRSSPGSAASSAARALLSAGLSAAFWLSRSCGVVPTAPSRSPVGGRDVAAVPGGDKNCPSNMDGAEVARLCTTPAMSSTSTVATDGVKGRRLRLACFIFHTRACAVACLHFMVAILTWCLRTRSHHLMPMFSRYTSSFSTNIRCISRSCNISRSRRNPALVCVNR
mmetsp:Transcript_39435/g.77585  ORF Transcript_39435/g.77585 Transcript_39435/m.77585 type:complete len:254 (-) Transcript_39435:762-1523(-)